MRRLLPLGLALLVLFECANVFFIMPLPGSQRTRNIDVAYALWSSRWVLRGIAAALVGLGLYGAWRTRWRPWKTMVPAALLACGLTWYINFRMAADQMFRQPTQVRLVPASASTVAPDRLVVGVEIDGQARAYPLQVIGYHHHLRDRIGDTDVLVTYCTVCRTGRVFSPFVNGERQEFRLVGMDQFNAMLEDVGTRSWWRQANGEAVIGPRTGTVLPEIPSRQVTLRRWVSLHPNTLVLEPDPVFADEYAKDYAYERGTSRKRLTGTDTSSWAEKSWVVGITVRGVSRAYDWNHLERAQVINDELNGTPIVLALASDSLSFFAFERPDTATRFRVEHDSLVTGTGPDARRYAFSGHGAGGTLKALVASQEFWHSWRTFQPTTDQYPAPARSSAP